MTYDGVAMLATQRARRAQVFTWYAIARALEEIEPGAVTIRDDGTMVGPHGPIQGGVMDELAETAALPSTVIRAPFAPPRFAPGQLPADLRGYYTLGDLVAHLGQVQVDALRELRALWTERLAGLATPDQVKRAVACIDAGLLVFPVRGETIATSYSHLDLPTVPAAKRQAWDAAADLFAPVINAWTDGLVAEARVESAALRRNVAAWDAIHAVTKAVAELPAKVAEKAAEAAGAAASGVARGLGPIGTIVALLALLTAVAVALGLKPRLPRKAAS